MPGTRLGVALVAIALLPAAGVAQINTTEGGVDEWTSQDAWMTWGYPYRGGALSIGQVFRTPAAGAFLEDFSFFFGQRTGGDYTTFRAFLAPWTGTTYGSQVWQSPSNNVATPAVQFGPLASFLKVDFNVNLELDAGQAYLAYIQIETASYYARVGRHLLAHRTSETADDGLGRVTIWRPTGEVTLLDNEDAAFKANFQTVAPEPATVVLLGSGLLGLGLATWRRRRTWITGPSGWEDS